MAERDIEDGAVPDAANGGIIDDDDTTISFID